MPSPAYPCDSPAPCCAAPSRERLARVRVRSAGGWLAVLGLLALGGCASGPTPGDATALIRKAEAALGSADMSTLTLRGSGQGVAVGQTYEPGTPEPALQLRVFSRSMHFDERAYREEFIRSPAVAVGEDPARTGARSGETRGVVLARQAFSWDVVGVAVAPAQTSWVSRMHDLWLSSPQGAVKAAGRHNASAGRQRSGWRQADTLRFEVPGQFSATLWLHDDGRVQRVDSVLPDPLLGDIAVRTEFLDYRLFGAVPFPQRIVQHQDDLKVLDIQVRSVALNDALEITVPENVRTTGNAPAVEWLTDGVWLLAGGTHHSVLVEQAGQLVLVEAPLDDERGRALVGAARRLAGAKPLGAVVNTHHHADQVGGLRVLAAEGATVLTSPAAQPWLEAAFRRPLTRRADPLGETATPPRVQAVAERLLLDDPQRPVEVHALRDSPHAAGMLVVWLPRQQLLVQADAWTPGSPDAAPASSPDPGLVNLVENLQRLGISPRRVVPLHGRVVPAADMFRQLGRAAPR